MKNPHQLYTTRQDKQSQTISYWSYKFVESHLMVPHVSQTITYQCYNTFIMFSTLSQSLTSWLCRDRRTISIGAACIVAPISYDLRYVQNHKMRLYEFVAPIKKTPEFSQLTYALRVVLQTSQSRRVMFYIKQGEVLRTFCSTSLIRTAIQVSV